MEKAHLILLGFEDGLSVSPECSHVESLVPSVVALRGSGTFPVEDE